MHKIGNQHSSLLDSLTKAASTVNEKENTLNDFVLSILKDKRPTFQEVVAQAERQAKHNLVKTAQFDDPQTFGHGSETSHPSESVASDTASPDTEGAKQNLVNALIALCGGTEEAKACIDASNTTTELSNIPEGTEIPGRTDNTTGIPAPMPM